MMMELQRAANRGYFPGAVALLEDGNEVFLISYPYADGVDIFVIAHTRLQDPTSWAEFWIDEIVLRVGEQTPAVPDEYAFQTRRSEFHDP